MRYRAKCLTSAMSVEIVELDAGSPDEAQRHVEASGGRMLNLKPIQSNWFWRFSAPTFNLRVFNQQLHTLLDAGQPIVDAINILSRNDRLRKHQAIYDTLSSNLQQGKQLSEAMATMPSVFPQLYVAMLRASETTGTVKVSIRRYMQYQQQSEEIRRKLVAAAIYPAILVAVAFVVIAFLMLYVVPRFSAVFDDVATNRTAVAGVIQIWGTFVRENTILAWSIFFAGLATIAGLVIHPRSSASAFRKVMTIPWLGQRLWILQLARMYRTLGMLLQSGVSVLTAMRMTESSLPLTMRPSLQKATLSVSEGKSMSSVMVDCGLSTEVSQRLMAAGESSGKLHEMMERIADFFDQETASWIDTAGRLIEPILMVGIGFIIGAIVLMLYSPIFDLANAV